MTAIEHRVEVAGIISPNYSGKTFSGAAIAQGKHRSFVGGLWDTHGEHQLRFLTSQGLEPGSKLLDIGCGSLRAGRHFVQALDPGNYYGIDANLSLIQAGYDVELTDEQRGRLPAANLRANDRFDGDFGVAFDMALAQSVFTHVSLNHIRLCLYRIAKVVRPGGKFYATFFEQPRSTPIDKVVIRRKGGRPFLTEQNVFWYYRSDLEWAARFGPWQFRYLGEWGHPSGQMMVEYTRLADAAPEPVTEPVTARRGDAARRYAARALRAAARRVDPR